MSRWPSVSLGLFGGLSLLACQAHPAGTLVRASPVPLEEGAPDRMRLGELRFEAGFVLTSDDPRFGGLSGLWLASDGQQLMMVSDHGTLWRATLEHEGDRLAGLADWSVAPLGRSAGDRSGRIDAESLAEDDAGGLIVAVEGPDPLRRIARGDPSAPAEPVPGVGQLVEAGAKAGNAGIEALTDLPGGGLLALSEGVLEAPGQLAGWRIENGQIAPLRYAVSDGFVPTGADWLDDTIYVVERRFSLLSGGFAARLMVLDAGQIREGALLAGHELARVAWPATTDNFEGIAVRRGSDGRTLLYLVSDDNFLPLQRTLLLQFSWAGP
jgi:hypothetical protein